MLKVGNGLSQPISAGDTGSARIRWRALICVSTQCKRIALVTYVWVFSDHLPGEADACHVDTQGFVVACYRNWAADVPDCGIFRRSDNFFHHSVAVPGMFATHSRPRDYVLLDPQGCKVFRVLGTLWCSQHTHCNCLAQVCHARDWTRHFDDHHFASLDGRTQIPGGMAQVVRAAASLVLVGCRPSLQID